MHTQRFAHLSSPGDSTPTVIERRRHEVLQRDARATGPSFLTPRCDALTAADVRGRILALLAVPASEVEPVDTAAYLALLDGPDSTPPVAVAVRDASARPDSPNAPSIALLAASTREVIAAE
jgi:hypothetical protein